MPADPATLSDHPPAPGAEAMVRAAPVAEAMIGAATGIGSWPGIDPMIAARITFQELAEPPYLPYLPELPARGPGADLVGRTAALLVEMPVDLQPSGWRLVDHPGRDLNRAKSFLRQDLDVLAEVADGYRGRLKLQVAGPWTLASTLWLPRLERAVADPGAVRDLIGSLAEGLARHVGEIATMLPGVELVVQLDEPGLTSVVEGSLPTASGFGRLRAVDEPVIVEGLRDVLDAATRAGASGTVLHSCAAGLPLEMLAKTGVGALSVDVSLLGVAGWEKLAELLEGGMALWAGAVPTSPGTSTTGTAKPDAVADSVWRPWQRLGLNPQDAAAVVITPACGLAGASPQQARATLAAAKEGARILLDRALS